jgi:hypothetical protein
MGGIVYLVRFDGKVLAAKSIEPGQKLAAASGMTGI